MVCGVIDINPGDYITIKGYGGSEGRLWCIIGANNEKITRAVINAN